MIEDKILGEIVGKNEFTEEEYEKLLKKYISKLKEKWKKLKPKPTKPKPKPEPTTDIDALKAEKARLKEELKILKSKGYNKLLEYREERNIIDRITRIDKQLKQTK